MAKPSHGSRHERGITLGPAAAGLSTGPATGVHLITAALLSITDAEMRGACPAGVDGGLGRRRWVAFAGPFAEPAQLREAGKRAVCQAYICNVRGRVVAAQVCIVGQSHASPGARLVAAHGTSISRQRVARIACTCARPTATTTSCSQLGDRSAINLAAASYCTANREADRGQVRWRGRGRGGVGGVGFGFRSRPAAPLCFGLASPRHTQIA